MGWVAEQAHRACGEYGRRPLEEPHAYVATSSGPVSFGAGHSREESQPGTGWVGRVGLGLCTYPVLYPCTLYPYAEVYTPGVHRHPHTRSGTRG